MSSPRVFDPKFCEIIPALCRILMAAKIRSDQLICLSFRLS